MSHLTRKEVLEKWRRRYGNADEEHNGNLHQAQELLEYHRKPAMRALGRLVEYEPSLLH